MFHHDAQISEDTEDQHETGRASQVSSVPAAGHWGSPVSHQSHWLPFQRISTYKNSLKKLSATILFLWRWLLKRAGDYDSWATDEKAINFRWTRERWKQSVKWHRECEMVALDFSKPCSLPCLYIYTGEQIMLHYHWVCHCFAAACKTDYNVCEDRLTCWVSVASKIAKREGGFFSVHHKKWYSVLCLRFRSAVMGRVHICLLAAFSHPSNCCLVCLGWFSLVWL